MKLRRNPITAQGGLTVIEMLISLIISAIILTAAYKTLRLQWRTIEEASDEAQQSAEGRRVLSAVAKMLRGCGYNPRATPYNMEHDLTRRIGIIAAYSDSLVCSNDTNEDGLIATALTLSPQRLPIAGKTAANEITAIRLQNRQLQVFKLVNAQSQWQPLAQNAQRLSLRYYNQAGDEITGDQWNMDPKVLSQISRLEIELALNVNNLATRNNVPAAAISRNQVMLRNPVILAP